MNNRTLIVGDLHGKWECVEASLNSEYEKIVFIGDYLDSFDRTQQDQLKTLDMVLDAIKEDPDRVTGLLGNHELSYLMRPMRCSGWNEDMQEEVDKRDLSSLKNFAWVNNYLLSHGGVSKNFLRFSEQTLEEYLESEDYYQIGRARGGFHRVGGLFWNDWFQEFVPLEDTPQVVGHSGYRLGSEKDGILEQDGNFNVDCLDHTYEYLVLEEGKEPKIVQHEDLIPGKVNEISV